MANFSGAVYTPPLLAKSLTEWAIQSHTNRVLDMGVGHGIFVFNAYTQLIQLGASNIAAQSQIYGSEIDPNVYKLFLESADQKRLKFENVDNNDFFNVELPEFDVVVGNPPYIRRRNFSSGIFETIRKKTAQRNPDIDLTDLSRLSDLYLFFLLSALPRLKAGGRLAAIVSDTWLNANYGRILKDGRCT